MYDPTCVENAYEAGLYYQATGKKPYSTMRLSVNGADVVSIVKTIVERLDKGVKPKDILTPVFMGYDEKIIKYTIRLEPGLFTKSLGRLVGDSILGPIAIAGW